uniref:Uncharacterized protein n=1 Tax=Rhizophagus irregularis (strain DAOM 181602 / DAOM 197198 / MUCL 43194) TaxID=747089 RepID=U9TK79_RHIID
MSHETRTDEKPPFVHKFFFTSNNSRRKPPKLCPDCKETSDCVKNFCSKSSTPTSVLPTSSRD